MVMPPTPYLPLVHNFDAFGWIPTIRGELSLNTIDNLKSLWGDVDKFFVEFKTYKGFDSSRYLVASSLYASNDSKKGSYYKTFRFVFRGTIKDEDRQNDFVSRIIKEGRQDEVKDLFTKKGILVGKLSIITLPSPKLTAKEKQLLESLKSLSDQKRKYNEACDKDAESFEDLVNRRARLKEGWEQVENTIVDIESGVENYHIYKFDVALSSDGLLFLRDDTCPEFRAHYCEENTPSDYTKNMYISRVFKTAMGYLKYLFHKNYHHREESDAFLPATNLHPIRQDINDGKGLNRMVKHQLDAFLTTITKMKRGSHRPNLCDPEGVLSYAESFLLVCGRNDLIKDSEIKPQLEFIDKQRNEYRAFVADKNAKLNFFLSQNNLIAVLTVALAVVVAVITSYNFLPKASPSDTLQQKLLILIVSFGLAILLHQGYILWKIFRGKFRRKKKAKYFLGFLNWLNLLNSNVNQGRFSNLYTFWLRLINIPKLTGIGPENVFEVVLFIAIIAVTVISWMIFSYPYFFP